MSCPRCGGAFANVQGYRQCTECGYVHASGGFQR